jgi:hypothetical protein
MPSSPLTSLDVDSLNSFITGDLQTFLTDLVNIRTADVSGVHPLTEFANNTVTEYVGITMPLALGSMVADDSVVQGGSTLMANAKQFLGGLSDALQHQWKLTGDLSDALRACVQAMQDGQLASLDMINQDQARTAFASLVQDWNQPETPPTTTPQ